MQAAEESSGPPGPPPLDLIAVPSTPALASTDPSSPKRIKQEEGQTTSRPLGFESAPIPLPSELVVSLLFYLPTTVVFRFALSSPAAYRQAILCISWIKFTSKIGPGHPISEQLSWTNSLSAETPLSSLIQLALAGPVAMAVMVSILRFAPRLRDLHCFAWPSAEAGTPLESELHSLLQTHPGIEEITLEFREDSNEGILAFLSPRLTDLELTHQSKPDPSIYQIIADRYPDLTYLSFRSGGPLLAQPSTASDLAAIAPLHKLQNLDVLEIGKVVGVILPTMESDCRMLLAQLAPVLPSCSAKHGYWWRLQIGPVVGKYLFNQFRHNVPLLREIVRTLHIGADWYALDFNHRSKQFFMKPEADQLAYFRFVVEEFLPGQSVCDCPKGSNCYRCSWFPFIMRVQPLAASYLLEKHFLPFVAKKSKQMGSSPDRLASRLLLNFDFGGHCEATVLAYIRDLSNPLDVGYKTHDVPMFCKLRHQSTREALAVRAKATNTDLGLNQRFEYKWFVCQVAVVVIQAAEVEPTFFLRNLRLLTTLDAVEADLTRLAHAFPWDRDQLMQFLRQEADLMSSYSTNIDLLWSTLEILIGIDGITALAAEIPPPQPMEGAPSQTVEINTLLWKLGQVQGANTSIDPNHTPTPPPSPKLVVELTDQ